MKRFYTVTRDLHLYLGLFIAPFLLAFSVSVFFLVHAWLPGAVSESPARTASNLTLPANLESLDGRARIDVLQREVLPALGIQGEIGFVRYVVKEHRLVFPVIVPGRETTVDLDLANRAATLRTKDTGVWDGLVTLHKSPGQHLVAIRMNWLPMLIWRWFADATVYLTFFLTLSGIYLWFALRAERRIGFMLITAGALSFAGIVYAVIR